MVDSKNKAITSLSTGKTLTQVQNETGLTYAKIIEIAREIGWTKKWRHLINGNRDELYLSIYEDAVHSNFTLEEIGKKHKVTRQRISQILKDMGISIRDIKKKRMKEFSKEVYNLLKSGNVTDKAASKILGVSVVKITKAKNLFTMPQLEHIEEKRQQVVKHMAEKRMEVARKMWPDNDVESIAKIYGCTVGGMHVTIQKYRSRYGWFPLKHKRK